MLQPLLFTAMTTLAAILVLTPIARAIGLVDRPSERKHHEGDIPLIGGIAVLISLIASAFFWDDFNSGDIFFNSKDSTAIFFTAGAMVVFTGALDDRFGLSILVRTLTEILAAVLLIEGLDIRVGSLGNIFGTGDVTPDPALAYAFTVVAIFGVINAFNMLDGVDGAVGSIAIIAVGAFHLASGLQPGFASLLIVASIATFLISNLQTIPQVPKTFLGDAGSKLLGLIVVCYVLATASEQVGGIKLIAPVTALFIVGLPVVDMITVILRRIARGRSPLAPDRSHLHHLLLTAGLSKKLVLPVIVSLCATFCLAGIGLQYAGQNEAVQMATFAMLALAYSSFVFQLTRMQKNSPSKGSPMPSQ